MHVLRRVADTPRVFSNWPTLLARMALERGGPRPSVLRFKTRLGFTIDCPNSPGARGPIYEAFADDGYRLAWFLRDVPRGPMRVIDMGAHVGSFTCQIAQRYPEAEIESLEPAAVTAGFLRRNVAQNGFAPRVTVIEAAVAARSGTATFSADEVGGSSTNQLATAGPPGPTTTVRTIGFDEVLHRLDKPVDLVKIDCEGAEYELIGGSSPESWSTVSRVVLEHHP